MKLKSFEHQTILEDFGGELQFIRLNIQNTETKIIAELNYIYIFSYTRWAPTSYKWSYGAPINGRKYMGNWGCNATYTGYNSIYN